MKQKRKKNKFLIAVLLVLLCAVAFVVVVSTVKKIEKNLYPIKYEALVEKYAVEYDLEEFLIYAVIHTESKFEPKARSGANAIGLMQITSETFDWIKSKIAKDEALTFESLYEPEVAVRFGCYYMAQCMKRYNYDIPTAAAAYHSGWGTVDKLLSKSEYTQSGEVLDSFPFEQMNLYVKKINKSYARYQKLYGEA